MSGSDDAARILRKFKEALAWQERGDLAQADLLCGQLLREYPAFADAWHLRGLLAFQGAQFERGIGYVQESLVLNRQQPAALGNIGNALLALMRPAEALQCFDEALRMQPDSAVVLLGRGKALHRLHRHEEALQCFDRALSSSPGDFEALINRGNVLFDLRRFEDSLASYDRCIDQRPAHVELLNNRGNALRESFRHAEALASYDRALALEPGLAETLGNRGNALLDMNRLPEALACYEEALRLRPDFADALDNRALALFFADRPAEAARSYARLVAVAPGHKLARSNLLFARSMCCDWSDYERECASLIESVTQGVVVQPFPLLSVSQSPELQQRCASRFVADRWGPGQRPPWVRVAHRHERLRVAYVSADLRQHAVGHLMAGVLEQHDRERVETIVVALQPEDGSATGQRIKNAVGKFLDVTHHSDRQVVQLLRDLEVDIAVDLMGLTRWSRPALFLQRIAPIQVSFLGYPGTVGSSFVDYLIADEVVIPRGDERWYTETIVRLPHSYLPNDDSRRLAPVPMRSAAGLPDDGFVFCAFTAPYKINPPMFDVWMRLLARVPDSVLWLRSLGADARSNLRREAANRGVSPERLVFAPHVPCMEEHLARQSLGSLFLDTLPYSAHSTACEALWAGLPVLTCAGQSMASRAAASVLTALELPELITHTLEDYERRALELAGNPELLERLRARLAQSRRGPLFDTKRYCRELERAFFTMQERALGGGPVG